MTQENPLTHAQMDAAEKVASDYMTNREIADSLGISPRTLDRWKHLPAFQAQVRALGEAFSKEMRKRHLDNLKGFL
jgi:FixJ family two-component response regulator